MKAELFTKLTRLSWLVTVVISLEAIPAQAQIAAGKSKFIGSVIPASAPSSFSTYWNQVTPENSGKWGSVEATRDVMNWTQLDIAYNYAKQRGYPFKQHTFVWGAQYPAWITSLSQADQRAEVEEWIAAFAQRYPNADFIDVVNEPIKTALPFKNALGGNGATGWDWVIWAFEKARQYCPTAKLLINEYGTENDGPVADQYVNLINILKSRGLIDGIGVQAHCFNLDYTSASTLQSTLNKFAATGLDIYISELDIRGISGNNNQTTQSQKYQELFPVIWNHASVKGITLWGYIEGQTWMAGTGIVNSNGTERPAMTWLKGFVAGSLNVSPASLSFGSGSGSSTVTVTSNVSWTVSDNQTWITTSPSSGTNNGSFSVSVTANTGASRSGTVTVTGGGQSRTVSVSQSAGGGGGSNTIVVRARGTNGTESVQLKVSNTTIATWTMTTGYVNRTATTSLTGGITVNFTNDASGRDVQVDYVQVNGSTRQAESQTVNTGVWQNSACGGSNSEWLHCNGYIGFGNVTTGGGRLASDETEPAPDPDPELLIYPNPSIGGRFTVSLPERTTELVVRDLIGRPLLARPVDGLRSVDVELDVTPGIYILHATVEEKAQFRKFLIK